MKKNGLLDIAVPVFSKEDFLQNFYRSFSLSRVVYTPPVSYIFFLVYLVFGIFEPRHSIIQASAKGLIIFLLLFYAGIIITSQSLIRFCSGMTFQQI